MIIFLLKYIIPLVASAFSQIFLHYEKHYVMRSYEREHPDDFAVILYEI